MKKIYNYLGAMVALFMFSSVEAQIIDEDFAGMTGTTPPAGWNNNEILAGGGLWTFDNPGGRTLNAPITDPAAIFDSDDLGSDGNPEESALETPQFDASAYTNPIILTFDHYFNGGFGGEYYVEVFDGTSWVTVLTGTTDTNDPEFESLDITADLNGATNAQVRFRWVGDWSYYWIVDNVNVSEVTCPSPTNLNASNVTATSVDLDWTNGGTETMWNIEYGAPGFAQGSGTVVAANSNPYTLTGLSPTTSYDIYLQADCGGGDESMWIGPINITTLIAPINCTSGGNTNLYSTDFESAFPSEWSNTATGDPQWEFNTGTTGSFGTGPDGAFTGNGYIFLETSGGAQGDADTIYPNNSVDLTQAMVEARISFYYHMFGAEMGELIVDVSDDGGATWTTEFTQVGQDQTAETDPWTPVEIDLTPYIGSTIEYRIIGVRGTGFEGDMAIDLFNIETCVSCPQPTDLVVNNITATSADVDWQLGNTETEWILEYDTTNFNLGTGNTMVTTNRPETISGLMPNTQHDVYVRAICGPGDTSSYSQLATFTTECVTYMAPFLEDFSAGVQPDCWDNLTSANSTSANAFWEFDNSPGYGASNNGRPDGTYAWSDGSTPDPDSVMLLTPNIDVSPLTNPYLEFDWFSNNEDNPGDNVPLIIDVLSNGTWDNLDTLATDSTDWMTVSYDLSAYAGQVIKVQFRTNQSVTTNSAFYNDILLDDVKIDNCIPEPGQDGSADICRLDDTLNLNSNIIVKGQTNGRWVYPGGQFLITNDSIFNVGTLPADTYDVLYLVDGICETDTTVASINVFPPSSAGEDGSVEVCLNEPVNLIQGLNGNVDLGGDWYDPSNNMLASGQIAAPSAGGNYNYDYITSNGVCPADTSLVDLMVDGDCDYLSLATEAMNEISIYPNPATEEVNIVNPANSEALKVEILDVNGRVVAVDDDALENTTEGTVAIDHLETGIYTIRIYNESGQKTFKLVKQ